jgi:hypothetical protein
MLKEWGESDNWDSHQMYLYFCMHMQNIDLGPPFYDKILEIEDV